MPVRRAKSMGDQQVLERLLASIDGGAARFEACCAAVASWPALVGLAERHGVVGVLERAVRRSRFAPPGEAEAALRRRAALQRLAQVDLVAASDEVLTTLDAAGVPAVALKGPVLGERLHGEPTLRVATDIDVMVAHDQIPASLAALERVGYRATRQALARVQTDFKHHVKLQREDRPEVELHYRLSTMFGVAIPSEEMLARSLPYRTRGGAHCRILSREDELVFLAIHAATHLFARLAWLYDIKVLLDLPPAPDWRLACDRAETQRVGRAFAFAISSIAARMEIDLPADAVPPRFRRPHPAASRFLAAASRSTSVVSSKFFGRCFRAALCDSPAIATSYLSRRTASLLRQRLRLG